MMDVPLSGTSSGRQGVELAGAELAGAGQDSRPGRAQPQVVAGRPVWPEHWGITRSQIKDLLDRLRGEPGWHPEVNVYTLVDKFIIPWTRGTGLGYALSLNREDPEEVTVMVSHAWGENAEDFLEALLRSCLEDDVLFVCALSIYQPEDGAGPSIPEQLGSDPAESPFRRVLEHIQAHGREAGWRWRWQRWLKTLPQLLLLIGIVLFYMPTLISGCIPTFTHCVVQYEAANYWNVWHSPMSEVTSYGIWSWEPMPAGYAVFLPGGLVFLVLSAVSRFVIRRTRTYSGRMVAVPNQEVDIYTRLWCVYEIFVARTLRVPIEMARSLAFAGKVSSRLASCSSPSDAARICSEIEARVGSYNSIDKAVFITTRRAKFEAAKAFVTHGFKLSVVNVGYICMTTTRKHVGWNMGGMVLGYVFVIGAVYTVFKRAQGTPSFCSAFGCGLVLLSSGWTIWLSHDFVSFHWCEFFGSVLRSFGGTIGVSGMHMMSFLLVGRCCCPPGLKSRGRWPVLMVSSAGLTAVLLLVDILPQALRPTTASSPEDLYPSAVRTVTFVAGYFWTPAYVWWSAALHWGVRVGSRER